MVMSLPGVFSSPYHLPVAVIAHQTLPNLLYFCAPPPPHRLAFLILALSSPPHALSPRVNGTRKPDPKRDIVKLRLLAVGEQRRRYLPPPPPHHQSHTCYYRWIVIQWNGSNLSPVNPHPLLVNPWPFCKKALQLFQIKSPPIFVQK